MTSRHHTPRPPRRDRGVDASDQLDHGRGRGTGDGQGRRGEVPEGCDQLAALLDAVADAEAAQARIVASLARLHGSGEAESRTGVPVELWLLSGGLPRSDRRMLTTAVTQLRRLPAVAAGFGAGTVSWGQVRTICLLAERLSTGDADQLDARLGQAVVAWQDADPDALIDLARQIVDRLDERRTVLQADQVEQGSFVSLQPRLDGTGGKLYGDLDGLGFGLVSASLSAGAPLPAGRRQLVGDQPERDTGQDTDGIRAGDGHDRWAQLRRLGKHRADRLVQLCSDDLARIGQPVDPHLPLTADTTGSSANGSSDPSLSDTTGSTGITLEDAAFAAGDTGVAGAAGGGWTAPVRSRRRSRCCSMPTSSRPMTACRSSC